MRPRCMHRLLTRVGLHTAAASATSACIVVTITENRKQKTGGELFQQTTRYYSCSAVFEKLDFTGGVLVQFTQTRAYLDERAVDLGSMIVVEDCTVRQAAARIKVSPSTVWRDVRLRLPDVNRGLAREVHEVFRRHTYDRKTLRNYL